MQNIELLDSQVYFSSEHSSWSYSILNEKNQEFCGQAVTNRLVSNFFCLATIQSNGIIATPTQKFPIPFIYSIIYACHVISRPHPSKMSTSVTSNVTTCPLCSVSIASVCSYVSHIRLSHYKDTDLDLTCNTDGCTAVFNTFSAFNSH